MTIINDALNNFVMLLVAALVIAMIVGRKFAEKHPSEANRLQVQAAQTFAEWLKNLFK